MTSSPPDSFFQKHENATIQVESTNVSEFMEAVRSDIEQALTSSGAKIGGGGTDRTGPEGGLADLEHFMFRYSEDEADGVINVWGVRGEGTSFNLIVLITES